MSIKENVSLTGYSTMKLGGRARYLAEAGTRQDIKELVNWATQKKLSFIVIGHGSNIVWRDEGYDGLVIVNKIMGRELDEASDTLVAAAGEKWDELVAVSAAAGLSGIEFLSAIPGTAGAAPVQNIGAYGAELSDVLTEVDVYDTREDKFASLKGNDCDFSYRDSRFKNTDRGRFIILSITLKLEKKNPEPPFYESLQSYFDEHKIVAFTPSVVRQAVIDIRKIKLPDPSVVNNNGSFFTNPIVNTTQFEELTRKYPNIKGWETPDGRMKISAGWLVEQAGFRDVYDEKTGMGTWTNSALVMINKHARDTHDLLEFRQKILDKVQAMFGIILEQEPELLPR
jgi:UDP-N-acetylmuramate dehydrogenase